MVASLKTCWSKLSSLLVSSSISSRSLSFIDRFTLSYLSVCIPVCFCVVQAFCWFSDCYWCA